MDSTKFKLLIQQPELHSFLFLILSFIGSLVFLYFGFSFLFCSINFIFGCAIAKKIGSGKNAYVSSTPSLTGKNIIITGANTGIGFETAKELAKHGGNITIACRNERKAKEAVELMTKQIGFPVIISYKILDLSNLDSVVEFVKNWGDKQIDILINNAGIMQCPYSLSPNGYELQFATNHLGHFLLTNLLLPNISNDGRIVNLSSIGHCFALNPIDWRNLGDEKSYDPLVAYGYSKIANIYFTNELQKRCKNNGNNISVYSVHPGAVKTELARNYSKIALMLAEPLVFIVAKTPNGGAQTSLYCATAPKQILKDGAFYNDCKLGYPSTQAQDEKVAKELWEISEEFCKDYLF